MDRLIKIGEIEPRNSLSIKESRLGLGMEKLDRDAFDPERVYDKVSALGVKWIRLQSGWQKTEKTEGVYDFDWLDSQVDNLIERGLTPWLCLCYGNRLYDPLAEEYFGAVGCPPMRNERAYAAWLRYVEATVKHFTGRIEYYEIWNEPEGGWTWRPEPNPAEYAEFCIKTGQVIKDADPSAKIITGSHYQNSMEFFNAEFACGVLEIADAVSYHSYDYDEAVSVRRIKAFKALTKQYGKDIPIIQGETGSQSKSGGGGAFSHIRTNPTMQTKYLLRHTVAEIMSGVKFTSIFSAVDMAENLDAKAGKPITVCGYFGLLGAEFDPNTGMLVGDYYEKPSYYAFRNLCSIFGDKVHPYDIPVIVSSKKSKRLNGFDCPVRDLLYGGLEKQNGSKAFAYWNSTDLITVQGYEGSTTLEIAGVNGDVHLIDPMDGSVYKIGDDIMKDLGNGLYAFENIPLKDYPLILTFGNFI
ncbi:MAG: beta-galactosidase [Clostridia bacterium]|nr:beta-galactosidase [Clostridia bacterium]